MFTLEQDPNVDAELIGETHGTHDALIAALETPPSPSESNDSPGNPGKVAEFMAAFGNSIHDVLNAPAQETSSANNEAHFDVGAEFSNKAGDTLPETQDIEPLDTRLAS